MKRITRPKVRGARRKKLVTTLGDLISAVYDAVPGPGAARRAMALLSRSSLSGQLSPHVEFVR